MRRHGHPEARLRRLPAMAGIFRVQVGMVRLRIRIQIRHDHRRLAARARLQRLRPGDDAPARIARGIVAIGNIAVGGLAIGSIAVGGATIGFSYAIGGRV